MLIRCLIVDDSPAFVRVARERLESQGIVVVDAAESVAEAVRQADFFRPDIILVDINLGAESGFDVASKFADGSRHHQPYVILISTHDESEFTELIETSPAVGFLTKTELSARAIAAIIDDAAASAPA